VQLVFGLKEVKDVVDLHQKQLKKAFLRATLKNCKKALTDAGAEVKKSSN